MSLEMRGVCAMEEAVSHACNVVGDRARTPHETNLFDIDAKYADVVALDDVVAYVAAPSGVPA